MKTGLLMSMAGMVLISTGTTKAFAACTSAPSCSTLGYSMSAADCPDGGVKCPFDTSKYFCYSICTYTKTADFCASKCKNVGSTSCVKDGTTYYSSCGSNKCSSSQVCSNGTCKSNSSSSGGSSSEEETPKADVYRGCCDRAYCSGYDYCINYYPDCSTYHSSCQSAGGSTVFRECYVGSYPYGATLAYFTCKY